MSRHRSILCCFAVITGAFLAADVASAQTTWLVDDDAPGDPAPGDPSISDPLEDGSAAHPFDAIQEAIDAAVAGDDVLIADGTYTGTGNKDLNFLGKAITVHSENGADNCIIDCEGEGRGVYFQNGEGPDSIFDGLTVTNGNPSAAIGGGGGAILCDSSSPFIANCTLSNNYVVWEGGGIRCWYSSPTITFCTIMGNTASISGGGVTCSGGNPVLTNCEISGNSTEHNGGGVRSVDGNATLTNCVIVGNSSTSGQGGGVYVDLGFLDGCEIADNSAGWEGGGVFCGDGTITNCTITGNSADTDAGGIVVRGSTSITNCTIENNSATNGYGGGVYSTWHDGAITDCTISGNLGRAGGGVTCDGRSPEIDGCTISYNVADYGGGVECVSNMSKARPVITNCEITGNHANVYGGGVRSGSDGRTGAYPTLINCHISANSADEEGGGVSCEAGDQTFVNCSIVGNSAALVAGGVSCFYAGPRSSSQSFSNCTIAHNSSPDCTGLYCNGTDVTFSNSVLWDDQPVEICLVSGSVTMNHTNIQGGWPGDGNIDLDPLFVDPDGPDDDPNTWEDNDYRLAAGSPCIDAGCNCAAPRDLADLDDDGDTTEYIPFDLDGEGRFFDDPATTDTGSGPPPVIDMGAYEFGGTDPQPIRGDLDADGDVDVDDLNILLVNYATPSGADGAQGDMYCDGNVNLSDLAAFLTAYAEAQP